jgi:hypothetical protein
MDHSTSPTRMETPTVTRRHRSTWFDASMASGFVATIMMSLAMAVAFGLARAVGDPQGGRIERWFAALASNDLIDRIGDSVAIGLVLNLVLGLVWAMIYGLWFAQRLPGAGWQRGMLFSLIPWLLSLLVFFPLTGLGLFGSELDAGILPAAGNLVLHLVYGAVLGTLYRADVGARAGDPSSLDVDIDLTPHGNRSTTVGMIAGGLFGVLGGWWLAPGIDNIAAEPLVIFGGLLIGAAMGMTLGTFAGMRNEESPHLPT